jgi:hypothetical protein
MSKQYLAAHGTGRLWRPVSLSGLLAATLASTGCAAPRSPPPASPPPESTPARAAAPAAAASEPVPSRDGRLRPPPLACDINQTTSWTGRVTGYRRDAGGLWFRIATDEDTVEEATLAGRTQADWAKQFLLRRTTFNAGDWSRIERKPGVLIEGMRATAWICEDGKTPPVIDWQPPGAE